MASEEIKTLVVEIQILRAKLIQAYNDPTISYEDVLTISQELDTLILEYHRLLAEINKKNLN